MERGARGYNQTDNKALSHPPTTQLRGSLPRHCVVVVVVAGAQPDLVSWMDGLKVALSEGTRRWGFGLRW